MAVRSLTGAMGRNDPSGTSIAPGRDPGWRPFHEAADVRASVEAADDVVVETGTTVVGVAAADAAVLAADRRASLGGQFVTNKRVRKVESVHPTAAVGLSGAVGHLQHFVRLLRAETQLYADRRGDPPSVSALATLAGNVLRGSSLRVSPVLGGVDGDGPSVRSLDGGGGVLADAYVAGGSGMQVAYGVLEREHEPDLSVEEASELAARAVDAAGERDTASGNGMTVSVVDAEGVAVDEFDALAEVAA